MQTKYLGLISCKYPTPQNPGAPFFKTPPNSKLINTHKRLFTFMLQKLSLLISSPEVAPLFLEILEYLFCTLPPSYCSTHFKLLQFAEIYWYSTNQSPSYWIKLRSLYISVIQKLKTNTQTKQRIIIRRAAANLDQFSTIIANQQLNSSRLQQLKCYFSPFDIKLQEDNIETFLYLYNKNIIPFRQMQFTRDNWIYNQLKFSLTNNKITRSQQEIMKIVQQNPYNPSVQQFKYLKQSQNTLKLYVKIVIIKFQFSDDFVLWEDILQLRDSLEAKTRMDLVEHYYSYHFPMYLKRQIHKDCDKKRIIAQLNHRYQIINKLVPDFDLTKIKKIITYLQNAKNAA